MLVILPELKMRRECARFAPEFRWEAPESGTFPEPSGVLREPSGVLREPSGTSPEQAGSHREAPNVSPGRLPLSLRAYARYSLRI